MRHTQAAMNVLNQCVMIEPGSNLHVGLHDVHSLSTVSENERFRYRIIIVSQMLPDLIWAACIAPIR